MRMRTLLVSLIAATASAAIAAPANAHPTVRSDAVSAWNETAGEAAVAACLAPTNNPLHESRMYAITHLAIHDALNAIERRSRPYAFDGHSQTEDVSRCRRRRGRARCAGHPPRDNFLHPSADLRRRGGARRCRSGLRGGTRRYSGRSGEDARDRTGAGRRRGHPRPPRRGRLGHHVVRLGVPAGHGAWEYGASHRVSTSRSPQAGARSPRSCSETARSSSPGPPYALTRKKYTADFNEVKSLGGDGVTTPSARTAEQTEIALFWVESSPLQWNRIARAVAADTRARFVGAGAPVRSAQHGARGRLRRLLRDQVPVQLLASGDRDPDRRHRRQPRHQRRPELDAAGADTSDPGLRLGAQRRRWSGGRRSSSGSSAPTASASRPAA